MLPETNIYGEGEGTSNRKIGNREAEAEGRRDDYTNGTPHLRTGWAAGVTDRR